MNYLRRPKLASTVIFIILAVVLFMPARLFLAALQVEGPVSFHGRVIDETDTAVAGATVTVHIRRGFDYIGIPWLNKKVELVTSEDGTFSISRGMGSTMEIRSIRKNGYRMTEFGVRRTFSFGAGDRSHKGDPLRPVSYLLCSSGAGRVRMIHGDALPIPWNGPALEVPVGEGKPHRLLIVARRPDSVTSGETDFPWSIEISVKNGQVLLQEDDLPLLAPASGYSDSVTLGYEPGPGWSELTRFTRVIFRTREGHHGIAIVSVYADRAASSKALRISSAVNEAGGRNLE